MVPPTPRLQFSSASVRPAAAWPVVSPASHPSLILNLIRSAYPALETETRNLESLLSQGFASDLRTALEGISPNERRHLHAALGAQLGTWLSLARESDPRNFWNGVLQLGVGLEESGDVQAAAGVYSGMLAQDTASSPALFRVRRRLEAITGSGELSPLRVGHLALQVVTSVTDAEMIAGFGVASGVAGLVRSSAALALLTRGAGPWATRWLAGSAAYLAEVPAFVGATQGLHYLREGRLDAPLEQSLFGAALFLGVLKISGLGAGLAPRAWQAFAAPTLSVGGIYLGHRLEEFFQLRAETGEANRWADVAGTFLQLRVGGRVAQGIVGSRFLSGHSLPQGERANSRSPVFLAEEGLPIAASGEGKMPRDTLRDIPANEPNMSLEFLRHKLGRLATEEVQRLSSSVGRHLSDVEKFTVMLAGSQIREAEVLDIAMHRLNHLVSHTRPFTARGHYLDWLTRHGMEELMRRPDSAKLDEALRFIHQGGEVAAFEQMLAPLLPGYRFPDLPRYGRYLLSDIRSTRRIAFLPLSQPARHVLHRFLQINQTLDEFDPFTVRPGEFLNAMTRTLRQRPELGESIDTALRESTGSPLGYLRVYRLSRVLAEEPYHLNKIDELADPRLRLHGFAERMDYPTDAREILRSPADAFIGDADLASFLADFYRRLPALMNFSMVAQRRSARDRILEEIWPRTRPLTSEDMLRAFNRFGDPVSLEIAREVREGRLRLLVLEDRAFNSLAEARSGSRRGEAWRGFYVPALEWEGNLRDSLVIRQLQGMSTSPFQDAAFYRLATVVHEFEHHRHARPGVERTLTEALRQEMLSHHREFHWLAEHGSIGWTSRLLEDGSAGWAIQLRDKIEGWYLVRRGEEEGGSANR